MIYVLIPGAWAGAWVWDVIATRLRQSGQEVHRLTLPGLGNGEDAAKVHLTTHVNAVIDYLESRELNDVVLVLHDHADIS
jgi:predicted GTPase